MNDLAVQASLQRTVLLEMGMGGIPYRNISAFARRIGHERSSVSRAIARLHRKGLVEMSGSHRDRGGAWMRSADGQAMVDDLLAESLDRIVEIIDGRPKAELEAVLPSVNAMLAEAADMLRR
jgi:DNA-binding MarR family transcriptional regulator